MTHKNLEARHGEDLYGGPPDALLARLSAADARRAYVDGGTVIPKADWCSSSTAWPPAQELALPNQALRLPGLRPAAE